MSQRRVSAGTSQWYAFGPQGETRQLTSSTGAVVDTYSYTAYGVPLGVTGSDPNPFRFGGQAGYYTDPAASGLVLCGARWYDPYTGRWLSRDPIGYEGGVNLYEYCEGNPVGALDPSGHGPRGRGAGCDDLLEWIIKLVAEIKGRWDAMRNDGLSDGFPLYPFRNHPGAKNPGAPGKGTWPGHQQQYRDKQSALRTALKDYAANRCGGPPPPDAWRTATRPAPAQPCPKALRRMQPMLGPPPEEGLVDLTGDYFVEYVLYRAGGVVGAVAGSCAKSLGEALSRCRLPSLGSGWAHGSAY